MDYGFWETVWKSFGVFFLLIPILAFIFGNDFIR